MEKRKLDCVEPPKGLSTYYDCKQSGAQWEFRCKVCRAGWSLPVSDRPHPGNILSLFNHAYGHKERRT